MGIELPGDAGAGERAHTAKVDLQPVAGGAIGGAPAGGGVAVHGIAGVVSVGGLDAVRARWVAAGYVTAVNCSDEASVTIF